MQEWERDTVAFWVSSAEFEMSASVVIQFVASVSRHLAVFLDAQSLELMGGIRLACGTCYVFMLSIWWKPCMSRTVDVLFKKWKRK